MIYWKVGKTYKDAAGQLVTILSCNAINEGYPIVGEVLIFGNTYGLSYYAVDGQCVTDGSADTLTLIEVVK